MIRAELIEFNQIVIADRRDRAQEVTDFIFKQATEVRYNAFMVSDEAHERAGQQLLRLILRREK